MILKDIEEAIMFLVTSYTYVSDEGKLGIREHALLNDTELHHNSWAVLSESVGFTPRIMKKQD